MNIDSTDILILGLSALIVIIIALFLTRKVKASLSKKGFELTADKVKENITVAKIQRSKIDLKNREGQNINVEDVKENSDIKIR